MPNKAVIYIGTVINLIIISAPLIFADIQIYEYLSHPVTWAYYSLISVFCFLEAHASLNLCNENTIKNEKVFLPYLTGSCILGIFWVSIYDFANYFQPSSIHVISGCLLIASGIIIRLISIKKLNKYFVSHIALLSNHQLITTGIYSLIRHPSELGLLLICIGVAILLSSITALWITFLLLLPLTIYRVLLEEKLLQSVFTAEYDKYKESTPLLLPKLNQLLSYRVNL